MVFVLILTEGKNFFAIFVVLILNYIIFYLLCGLIH